MAASNFYLANKNKRGDKLIVLFFNFDGKRMQYSTGETVPEKSWNSETQRVKKTMTGAFEINGYLEKIENDVRKIYRELKTNDENISPEILKEKLERQLSNSKSIKSTLFSFIQDYISSVEGQRQKSSITVYRNAARTLEEYKTFSRKRIDFDTINLDFYNDFSDYLLKQKGFATNTIGKHIKTLKTFLNEATERGLNTKLDYKSKRFKVVHENSDSIYLSENELESLFDLSLKSDARLDKVKDLFLIGCYTGLRFSDFSQLKRENINNGLIKIRTQKTDELVAIPVHNRVKDILTKYEGNLPSAISNQKMNEYLKEIGKLAEINEKTEHTQTKGGERFKTFYNKYDLITTHTARRSFATNLYLQGFPSISIMKITGHKTEKAFMRYLKISQEQNAELLAKFWRERAPQLKKVV